MRLAALAFLCGIVALQQLAQLPALWWSALGVPCAVLAWRWPRTRWLGWLIAGFCWALLRAHLVLDTGGIEPRFEGVDLSVEGTVVSLPRRTETDLRFVLDVDTARAGDETLPPIGRARLSWRNPDADMRVGDRWRLTVRLKHPHGFMNPGGWDYEGWLYQQGVRATGYVRVADAEEDAVAPNQLLARGAWSHPLDQWRQDLAEGIATALNNRAHRAIVAALAIGVTQDFTETQWDVLNRTGTTHLVSISGLHIGFIAGVAFFLMRWLWSRAGSAPLRWPAPKAAAVAALVAATIYAALAGFSVPTQRSLVMVAVVMGMILLQRRMQPGRVFALALIAVLLLDPLAVLQPGFWLSFGAVAVILFATTGRWDAQGWWWKWGHVQWVVAIGLLPLMLILFQRSSVVAPLANLLAVPWFNVITVPLTLLGALTLNVAGPAGEWLLRAADWSIAPMWWLLERMAETSWSQWSQHVPPLWTVVVATAGAVWLLFPRGIPARWLGVVLIAPVVLMPPAAPRAGEFWFTLLDVGQGLATVVRTEHHVLVYDTGPRFSEQFDTGDAVVLPYLRHLGARAIDLLILSHGDSDHVGGARSLVRAVDVRQIMSSMPVNEIESTAPCHAPDEWQWDGVTFTVLYPPPVGSAERRANDNDVSCVLRVQGPGGSVLLTGDIEAPSEKFLVERASAQLRADVVVAPHHGSLTSSTPEFISAVAPRDVLFPVGYRNRFGFPKPAVAQRYRDAAGRMYDSATHGAITFRVTREGVGAADAHRISSRRYWHHSGGAALQNP
jgi:competence protein ComEC